MLSIPEAFPNTDQWLTIYRQTSITSGTLVGNKIVYHSDFVGAAPRTQMLLEHRL